MNIENAGWDLKPTNQGREPLSLTPINGRNFYLASMVDSGAIRTVQPDEELLRRSYAMAARNMVSVYDTIFVSLALEIGLELKTFDGQQSRIMRLEAKHG